MRKSFQVFTVLSCSLFAMNSFAADLYVSVNNARATDASTNPGTDPNVPLKSIQRAAALAVKGTTVHVAAGTYNVSAPGLDKSGIDSMNSGTATARIRFLSDPKNRAKIVVSGTGIAWNSRGSYVDIDGFEITGSGRHGILAWGAHLTITNNYIHDITVSGGCNGSGGSGIDTPNTVGDVLISGNIVRNIGYSMIGSCNTVQGIYIASPNNTVINNIVSGVALAGIQQWHGATASAIINNTVFHCKDGILIGDGDAGTLPNGSENNYVANNIVYDNLAYGIIEYGLVGANNRYVNNLVYKSGTSVKMQKGSVSGTISQDPMFVRYEIDGSGDYHLQPSSPAIGKGTLTSAPPTDFDGKARGSTIDIGAYEYAGTAPSPSPSPSPSPTASPKPVLSLSASSLNFGSVIVGSSSSAQVLTLKNTGNANLSITSAFVFSSGFGIGSSGTCSTSVPLAPGASCIVNIVFKPTVVGSYNGSLSIATNASSSPVLVKLAGVGASPAAPALSLSASSINFGSVNVGSSSSIQYVTITNTGNATLTFGSSSLSGDFQSGLIGTCTPTLAVGASCTYSAKFVPTASGTRTGVLSIASNAASSPALVQLTGVGVSPPAPALSLSASSLNFGSVKVGTSSAVQALTIKNSGNADLKFTSAFVFSSGFGIGSSGTCSTSVPLSAGQSCVVYISFKPTAVGSVSGSLKISTNVSSTAKVVPLSGTGI